MSRQKKVSGQSAHAGQTERKRALSDDSLLARPTVGEGNPKISLLVFIR